MVSAFSSGFKMALVRLVLLCMAFLSTGSRRFEKRHSTWASRKAHGMMETIAEGVRSSDAKEQVYTPSISILTGFSGDREWFLAANVVKNFLRQSYAGQVELVVVDFAKKPSEYLQTYGSTIQCNGLERTIRYIHRPIDVETEDDMIGAKRNCMLSLARNDIIVHMDADDYYGPNFIQKMIQPLIDTKNIKLLSVSCDKGFPALEMDMNTGKVGIQDLWRIKKVRDSNECNIAWLGALMAYPRFLVNAKDGIDEGLQGSKQKLNATVREDAVHTKTGKLLSCLSSINDLNLTHTFTDVFGDREEWSFVSGLRALISCPHCNLQREQALSACETSSMSDYPRYCDTLRERLYNTDSGKDQDDFAKGLFFYNTNRVPEYIKLLHSKSLTNTRILKINQTTLDKKLGSFEITSILAALDYFLPFIDERTCPDVDTIATSKNEKEERIYYGGELFHTLFNDNFKTAITMLSTHNESKDIESDSPSWAFTGLSHRNIREGWCSLSAEIRGFLSPNYVC
mmetsp:Transcript_13974/g.21138  ORF Transcript_13974/g.21138 Transcript_13974/m.21138 type:complete len:513 (+) Transcript_13974:149-1687(+)